MAENLEKKAQPVEIESVKVEEKFRAVHSSDSWNVYIIKANFKGEERLQAKLFFPGDTIPSNAILKYKNVRRSFWYEARDIAKLANKKEIKEDEIREYLEI